MTTLTIAQATTYATAAGFTGQALDIIVAIARAESSLVTDARNVNSDSHTFPDGHVGPSTDRGVLQVNNFWHPEYSDAQCDDPAQAFAAGYTISHQGSDFTPWSTYKSGAYLKFMPVGGSSVSNLPTDIPRNPAPLSQLHEPTKDGQPDENTRENCGEAAAAWVVRDIGTEKDCDGDEIHDAVIGQGVIGGSDLLTPGGSVLNPRYVAALAQRGVALTLYRGTQAELVAKCHAVMNLPAGDVVANFGGGANYLHQFSDPAHYNGFGHICAVAHSVAGGLELMDPWIGGYRTYTDAQLEQMIVWGYIVVATPAPVPVTTGGVNVSGVPAVAWTDDAATETLTAPNKESCGHGIRAHVKGESWPAELWPVTGEEWDPVGVHQDFRNGGDPNAAGRRLTWHKADDSITESALASPAVALASELAAAQSAEASAQSAASTAQSQAASLQTQLSSAESQIASLTAQIATLKSQPAPVIPVPVVPVAHPAPTTPAAAAVLLVQLVYAEAEATLKAVTPA